MPIYVIPAIEWGSDRKAPTVVAKSDSFLRLAGDPDNGVPKGKMAHSLRSMGSAALNFAMVAQGGLDMYWCGLIRDTALMGSYLRRS